MQKNAERINELEEENHRLREAIKLLAREMTPAVRASVLNVLNRR